MRLLLCAFAVPFVFTGCASIVSGHNQPLSVEARSGGGEPVIGATCKLANDKGEWYVTTPGSATVRRSYENLAVRCEKDPLDAGLASVASSTKGMAFGNILFGGIIGVGVDIGTGAAYDYPPLLTVVMGQAGDGISPEAKAVMAKAKTPAERAEINVAAQRAAAEPAGAAPVAAAVTTPPAVVVTTAAPPQPARALPTPASPAPPIPAAPAATVAAVPPPAALLAPATPAPPASYAYKYLYQAEHVPEVRACPFGPGVSLVAVSPGVEVYSAQCGRAEALMLRCEWGTCRVLK